MSETGLLDTINSIEDFKRIDEREYERLAREIRVFLVDCVAKHGGHLASNLGAVELTMALHKVFNTPDDHIVFDVGHQAYVHKLLTGRRAEFDTLRVKGGLSGFPKRNESAHDAFNTGHSSTSVSAALGILRAKRLRGDMSCAVAVIGDGAMTGGMCFEALNDAGQSQLPLIVILNDNEMSIDGNVGALSTHLSKLRVSTKYRRFKSRVDKLLKSIPKIGPSIARSVLRNKNRIKYFLLPRNVWFEAIGFTYLGPIDGHDAGDLINVLKRASGMDRPVMVHVITKKGKGYSHAEEHPEKFHGIGCFHPDSGMEVNEKKTSNSSVFGDALAKIAQDDNRVVAITAAMTQGTGLVNFAEKFPNRFFDVGIAEQHAVTMAAGMASAGMRPVAAIYSTFLQRAYDQMLHDVCLQKLPVLFAVDRAGLVGEDGETHQGAYDIAYMLTMPNIAIYSPATQNELRAMLKLALRMDVPASIRYGRCPLPVGGAVDALAFGKWEEVKPLCDIVIIATGRVLQNAITACEGLDVGIINARFIRPLDMDMLQAVNARARCVITLEDGIRVSGMGAYIAQSLKPGMRVIHLGIPELPIEHAALKEQDEQCGLSSAAIRKLVEEIA